MVTAIENLARKGFVKFPKADVFDAKTCILQKLWNCINRANPHLFRCVPCNRHAAIDSQRCEALYDL
jgi:hypothetical protein